MDTIDTVRLIISPTSFLIEKAIKKSLESFDSGSKKSTLQELKEEALRQQIHATVLQNQAKVEQELAIARRIDSAEEVEIEEYYDASGKGALGISGNEEGITLGTNAEGRKVVKRIIKFKGCRLIEQTISE